MIVLVFKVWMTAKVASEIPSSTDGSDLLQTEDPFTGNFQQDASVDIGLFPRELKNEFSAVVASQFEVSSADCFLLDSPPAVILRNFEQLLHDRKKLSEFRSRFTSFLKQNNYLKSYYRVTVERILRDQNITEFFFNYYEQARSALQNIICPNSCLQQSICQGNVPPRYLLIVFPLENRTILDVALSSQAVESVLDRICLSCNNHYLLLIKAIAVESDKLTRQSISLANLSLPVLIFSTPAEVNEQLLPLFAMDVSISRYCEM
jgi:hypothetical protein